MILVDWSTLFGGVGSELIAAITGVMPAVVGIFVVLAGVGIAFRLFSKVGARR